MKMTVKTLKNIKISKTITKIQHSQTLQDTQNFQQPSSTLIKMKIALFV